MPGEAPRARRQLGLEPSQALRQKRAFLAPQGIHMAGRMAGGRPVTGPATAFTAVLHGGSAHD